MKTSVAILLIATGLTPAARADIQCTATTLIGSQSRTKVKHRAPVATSPQGVSVANVISWPIPATLSDVAVRRSQQTIDPREQKVFTINGDVWRIKREENDCDFHVEMTAPGGSVDDPRIIIEIPQERVAVRNTLIKAVKDSGGGDLTSQKQVDFKTAFPITVTGLGFIDGYHWTKLKPKTGSGHGSALVATLWELHPVFGIAAGSTQAAVAKKK